VWLKTSGSPEAINGLYASSTEGIDISCWSSATDTVNLNFSKKGLRDLVLDG